MTTPHPDPGGPDPADTGAMETFTVTSPRWLTVLFSRNPLIRLSDRVEALALILTVVVSLLAAPVAGAAGTAVHDSRSRLHAEQAARLTTLTATVIDAPARSDPTMVRARWFAAGTEHTGTVKARMAPKPGETIAVLVNPDGSYAGSPRMSAAREAVFVALAIWLNVATAAALVFVGVRTVLNRARLARWQPELVHTARNGRLGRP